MFSKEKAILAGKAYLPWSLFPSVALIAGESEESSFADDVLGQGLAAFDLKRVRLEEFQEEIRKRPGARGLTIEGLLTGGFAKGCYLGRCASPESFGDLPVRLIQLTDPEDAGPSRHGSFRAAAGEGFDAGCFRWSYSRAAVRASPSAFLATMFRVLVDQDAPRLRGKLLSTMAEKYPDSFLRRKSNKRDEEIRF